MKSIPVLFSLIQRWPNEVAHWRALRDARIRKAVEAAAGCPYYQELFHARGIRPADIRTAADLQQIPPLKREHVRARGADMVRTGVPLSRCRQLKTSGTTGEPTLIYASAAEVACQHGLWFSGYMRAGMRPWHRQAKYMIASYIPENPHLFQRIGLFRRAYQSASTPTREKLDWLRQIQPDVLFTWGSILNELWHLLDREQKHLTIPLIITSSDQVQREQVAHRIKGRIVDVYGAVETGPIAWGCADGEGYHVDPRWVQVEVVDDQGQPAQKGHVLCTPTWRRTMPLIRYQLGDLAEWAETPCGCGNPLPRIRALVGRQGELLSLPHGARLPASVLGEAIRPIAGLTAFQFVQRSEHEGVLYLVPGPDVPADAEARVRAFFDRRFGPDVTVHIRWVDVLYRPPSEKFRSVYTLTAIERLRRKGVDVEPFFAP